MHGTLATLARTVTALVIVTTPLDAQSDVQVQSYELDVAFHPDRAAMDARAHIEFQPPQSMPDSLVFYLHGELSVDSILWEGVSVPFDQEKVYYFFDYSLIANRAVIETAGRSLSSGLTVFYQGYVNPSRARSPSDYMRVDADGVLLRGYAYSPWFPIFLESWETSYSVSFTGVTIRTPRELRTVFIGTKLDEREEGDQRVTEWRADGVDLFEVQCSARRWDVTSRGDVHAYHNPTETSRRAAENLLEYGERLSTLFRRYFRSDAVAPDVFFMEMPRYGEISSGNVVGLSTRGWHAFEQMDLSNDTVVHEIGTIAHELVHSFVRFPMDYSDPLWPFMIEGFPSYFYKPVLAELNGEEYYRSSLRRTERIYLRNRERAGSGGVPEEKPLLEITAEEIPLYKDRFVLGDRGSLFFNYLRTRMGRDRFFEFTRELFSRDTLDVEGFEQTILNFLPDAREDVRIWLTTTDYPERIRLAALWP